jgi:predicted transcriptional regulator
VQKGKDRNRNINTLNPKKLSPLGSAAYVLECIKEGKRKEEIVQRFNDDEQLVSLWLTFLKANDWLEEDHNSSSHLVVTEEGKQWIETFDTCTSS